MRKRLIILIGVVLLCSNLVGCDFTALSSLDKNKFEYRLIPCDIKPLEQGSDDSDNPSGVREDNTAEVDKLKDIVQ